MTYYGQHLEGANFLSTSICCNAPGPRMQCPGHIRLRPGAPAGCMAELGSRQPRSAPHRFTDRPAAGTRCGHFAVHVARYTPMYYGDEIGMTNVPIAADRCRIQPRRTNPASAKAAIQNERRCAGIKAAFWIHYGVPWLPLGEDLRTVNVAVEQTDSSSILTLHKTTYYSAKNHPVGQRQIVGASCRNNICV